METSLAQMDFATARALYEWQVELGADEPVGDLPVDRYEAEAPPPTPRAAPASAVPDASAAPRGADPVAVAAAAAARASTLEELAAIQAAYELCELKKGARNFVFADGNPEARVMIIGEAPGRDEDIEGRPFVGRAGQLLDRMFAAIGLARTAHHRDEALYITNVMPWRPPQNREPEATEIAMMLPFLERHVALANPDLVVLMGNTPCAAALGKRGILRLRGHWAEALGRPALPMTHPAYLLRNPAAKREAWADLLEIKARLKDPT
ncbi:uracil-DNA glycosylase [Albidovulum sediminicola]|uniref:Type-4 uracil-DNA glycosylase n=1 Tax=Albidovulum sediminicola TaxID=2984331 RepID=A0ABT2YYJ3_9RHOB|nr:uracil-DNA glycosylase [Defluviimonas sp. WL0075]MCV2863916.1 uracil-DNA glycosylase [Defluviimonas sp. WL0075]